jgi:hypothetical protein
VQREIREQGVEVEFRTIPGFDEMGDEGCALDESITALFWKKVELPSKP